MIAVILLVIVVLLLWFRRPQRPENFPPGPPTFLIFGNVFVMIDLMRRKVNELMKASRDRYGDIVGFVLSDGSRQVHLFAYEDVKEACFSADLVGRPAAYGFMVRMYNQQLGLVFNEGPSWVEHRRFALRHLRDMGFGSSSMETIVQEEIEAVIEEMIEDTGALMKVNNHFNSAVVNIIWRLVTNTRMERKDPKMVELQKTVDEVLYLLGPQTPVSYAPWLRFVAPEWSGYSGIVRHREKTAAMFRSLIDEHRKTLDPAQPRDFIDCFLLEMGAEDAEKRLFTELNLTVIGMDFFVAGMETTSTSLSWAMLLMVMYPDVQTKVQQEIDRELGKEPALYSDHTRMPYTEATLMEMFRRCNVIPLGVPHSALTDTTLRGYSIPKNTQVVMNMTAIHSDPEYWGDPGVFRPERFINEDGSLRKDEHVIPFGVGKRFCLGETLARMELFIIFVSLLQKFTFSSPTGQDLTLETEFSIVHKPKEFSVTYELRE